MDVMKMGAWMSINNCFDKQPYLFSYWLLLSLLTTFIQVLFLGILIKT